MNLEVDVMEGDRFVVIGGSVYQERGNQDRCIRLRYKGEWTDIASCGGLSTIDLPTFTRYCEGCGLTVKQVKPEPKVETIKPPEWVVVKDGEYHFFDSEDSATRHSNLSRAMGWSRPPQRIDWGAK